MLIRIVLRSGRLSADILKKSIVHFKQLRSLELSDAVFMNDSSLWEVLGTLPSLANLILAVNPPAHAPKNSNTESGCPKYFEALESLCVTGTFFLIQRLLSFIDSPCLRSIKVYPVINRVRKELEHEDEGIFTPSMMVVSSKWSQSLKNLFIISDTSSFGLPQAIATLKCLMLLTDLHEMQCFHLINWKMENMDDDVRRLVTSWPKLRTLKVLSLNETSISLSTLKLIAENCPELRHLQIQLDTSTIPPFDTSSKSLYHKLEILTVGGGYNVRPSNTITQTSLRSQIQVTRYLDLIFPYLKGVEMRQEDVFWLGIRDLVELCQDARRIK